MPSLGSSQFKVSRVEQAIREGCRTSWEVAQETGIDRRACCMLLRYLARVGRLRKTNRTLRREVTFLGPKAVVYEPNQKLV